MVTQSFLQSRLHDPQAVPEDSDVASCLNCQEAAGLDCYGRGLTSVSVLGDWERRGPGISEAKADKG